MSRTPNSHADAESDDSDVGELDFDELDADDLCVRLVTDRLRVHSSRQVAEFSAAATVRDVIEDEALTAKRQARPRRRPQREQGVPP